MGLIITSFTHARNDMLATISTAAATSSGCNDGKYVDLTLRAVVFSAIGTAGDHA